MIATAKQEQELMRDIFSFRDDPYGFVMYAFPWGKKGTPLEALTGPREWQREELLNMKAHIEENKLRVELGQEPELYQFAMASGRGPGKSAFVGMITMWMMSCHIGATTIVTANGEPQLNSKTMPEIRKWHTLSINSHWFDASAMSIKPAPWFANAVKTLKIDTGYYYAQGQLWSEEKPDSFAGAHNPLGILLIFDEASGIPKSIWGVSEGFFTEPTVYRFWLVFSNPRRNTGSFFECFHAMRKYWRRRNLDSRHVEGTDKRVLQQIIEKYGEDSDEARIEVKGEFPRQGDKQFISRELVENAKIRELQLDEWAPLMMGVDPARYGDDSTVIRFRQGRNARIIPPVIMKGADNMKVANTCADLINKYNPDAVCIDAGNGTGIIDRLKELKFKVHEVWFGSSPEKEEWADKRTELWGRMRDWLGGACIDESSDLSSDLTGPQYDFVGSSDRLKLEAKEKMKKRGIASPDHADALACTFAVKVARTDIKAGRSGANAKSRIASGMDYNVFGD